MENQAHVNVIKTPKERNYSFRNFLGGVLSHLHSHICLLFNEKENTLDYLNNNNNNKQLASKGNERLAKEGGRLE